MNLGLRRLSAALICALLHGPALAQTAGSSATTPAAPPAAVELCGEVLSLPAHEGSQRYAWRPPAAGAEPLSLILLPGGAGYLNLDERGCPRALSGNSLVRSIPLFAAAGFGTALLDAPTAHQGEDGLGGYRIAPEHAADIGRVVAELRARTKGRVWIVGTSRGAISAANAAARLSGAAAADGVVLTSALMSGDPRARKFWVAHSVFDLPLEEIRMPLLLVGHAADRCVRSPAARMGEVIERAKGATRKQMVTVSGGPGTPGPAGLAACEGRTPHGYVDQESEVAAGIVRFVKGGAY